MTDNTKEEILAKNLGWGKFSSGQTIATTEQILSAMEEYAERLKEENERLKEVVLDLSGCLETICKEYDRDKLTESAITEGKEILLRHKALIQSFLQTKQ